MKINGSKEYEFIDKLKLIKKEIEKRFAFSKVNKEYVFPRKNDLYDDSFQNEVGKAFNKVSTLFDLKTQRSIKNIGYTPKLYKNDYNSRSISRLKVVKCQNFGFRSISPGSPPLRIFSVASNKQTPKYYSQMKSENSQNDISINYKRTDTSLGFKPTLPFRISHSPISERNLKFRNSNSRSNDRSKESTLKEYIDPNTSRKEYSKPLLRGMDTKMKNNLRVLKSKVWNFNKLSKSDELLQSC